MIRLLFTISLCNAIKSNGDNFINKRFICGDVLHRDLEVLTAQEISYIAKPWYNYLLSEMLEGTEDLDNLDRARKIKSQIMSGCLFHNMNELEKTFHRGGNWKYYAWIPREATSKKKKDILACMSLYEDTNHLNLTSLLINPMWRSENIGLYNLKTTLNSLVIDDKHVCYEDFLKKKCNKRIDLEWMLDL